jgi:transcriptional regulator with XRE-family HTH domain
MSDKRQSDYEAFESSSPANRRLLRQEAFILDVTECLVQALERRGIARKELADRISKSKSFVSQVLQGGRNLTLRTVADLADALDCRPRLQLSERVELRRLNIDKGRLLAWRPRLRKPAVSNRPSEPSTPTTTPVSEVAG